MRSFYFTISGSPHFLQEIYNRFKDSLSDLNYSSDSYSRFISLQRGSSEIEVLDKKGYIILHWGNGFSIYSHFSTNFFRKNGGAFGKNSKLVLKVNSEDPNKMIKVSSKISQVDSIFESKKNYSFEMEEPKDFDFFDEGL
ncbi:hypothetical protein GW922_03365 [Candidatus Pacearchaeota archaeon]|nr:hypothetical protein [Candidatus Pacearchaeota archaeon]